MHKMPLSLSLSHSSSGCCTWSMLPALLTLFSILGSHVATPEAPLDLNSHATSERLQLRLAMKCVDRPYEASRRLHNDYWVLQNFIRAEHGALPCASNITFVTYGDYTSLRNLVPLLRRWRAPISLALHVHSHELQHAMDSIEWWRQCHQLSPLVRSLVTFHLYYHKKLAFERLARQRIDFQCTESAPSRHQEFTRYYPSNVGRNVARNASQTYFVLVSDIEFYPSLQLAERFMRLLSSEKFDHSRRVYTLRMFQLHPQIEPPETKAELQQLFFKGLATPFHLDYCRSCHDEPLLNQWIRQNDTNELSVFNKVKRIGRLRHWDPSYIGTTDEPPYDEQLTWRDARDKSAQAYALCVADYQFHDLDNAFLVQRPGLRLPVHSEHIRYHLKDRREFLSMLEQKYGRRKDCTI